MCQVVRPLGQGNVEKPEVLSVADRHATNLVGHNVDRLDPDHGGIEDEIARFVEDHQLISMLTLRLVLGIRVFQTK